ncbi:hypothetical protein IW262DRAFT_1400861 [Armillaria fumosa]|nr:hypothetical protein IW262DRAFT_1400861 [Armillaria fumosa]
MGLIPAKLLIDVRKKVAATTSGHELLAMWKKAYAVITSSSRAAVDSRVQEIFHAYRIISSTERAYHAKLEVERQKLEAAEKKKKAAETAAMKQNSNHGDRYPYPGRNSELISLAGFNMPNFIVQGFVIGASGDSYETRRYSPTLDYPDFVNPLSPPQQARSSRSQEHAGIFRGGISSTPTRGRSSSGDRPGRRPLHKDRQPIKERERK